MIKHFKNIFSPSEDKSLALGDFNKLYKEHNEFVRRSIYWFTRTDEIDDIVQDTFYKAWKNFHKFKQDSSFRTWIYQIAKNTCYDYQRKNKRKVTEIEDKSTVSNDQIDLKDLISKGLLKLKDSDREVFVLFYKMGHTQEEISELTGLKLGTIKSKIHYAKKEFVLFLKENGVHNE